MEGALEGTYWGLKVAKTAPAAKGEVVEAAQDAVVVEATAAVTKAEAMAAVVAEMVIEAAQVGPAALAATEAALDSGHRRRSRTVCNGAAAVGAMTAATLGPVAAGPPAAPPRLTLGSGARAAALRLEAIPKRRVNVAHTHGRNVYCSCLRG